jgi:hypothetical protein
MPDCVREVLEFVYPTVDWDRVTLHLGFPHVIGWSDKSAVTLPGTFSLRQTHIYFKEDKWDPCSCDGLGLIVHEGFHVHQIQDVLGGYGLGLFNPSTISYLACWAGNGFSYDGHNAEDEAYAVAGRSTSLYDACCSKLGTLPCDCRCVPPTIDQAGLQNFETDCRDVIQSSSGGHFWRDFAGCVPGLEQLGEWAEDFWPLYIVYGVYYVVWLIVWGVVALLAAIGQVVAAIVGGIVSGIVGVGEAIWDAISSPFSDEASSWIWSTRFDGTNWLIPDVPVTQDDRTKTSTSPSLAEYDGLLYMAYRSADNSDLWYNVFDGTDWLAQDRKITTNGHTKTSASPSLAAYDGLLYMAYRSADNSDLWYNVFDGTDWLDEDCRISRDDRVKTGRSPSLRAFDGLLRLVYRDDS